MTLREAELGQTLTQRESEILDLVISGLTSKEIARRLGNRPRTVEYYRRRVRRKFGARNSAELTRLALLQRSA